MPPRRERAQAAAAAAAATATAPTATATAPAAVPIPAPPVLLTGEREFPEYPLLAEQHQLEQRVLLLTSIQELLRLAANQQSDAQRLEFVSGEVSVDVIQRSVIYVLEMLLDRLRDIDRFLTVGGHLLPSGEVQVLTYPAAASSESSSAAFRRAVVIARASIESVTARASIEPGSGTTNE